MGIIFISESYHNKEPQTEWLKTNKIYFLKALEAKILNSVWR